MKCFLILFVFLLLIGLNSPSSAQTICTKYPQNPILEKGPNGSWDDDQVVNPIVIYDEGLYKMWYNGGDGSDLNIGYATSADGIVWTKYAENPVISVGEEGSWYSRVVGTGPVLVEEGTYKMWFFGFNGTNVRIGYATSPDGINWTKYENPVLDLGDAGTWDHERTVAGTVHFDGEIYKMWYHGQMGNKRQTGYAISADGISWTKHESNPVLETGPTGSWDDQMVCHPVVIASQGNYQMWYCGVDGQRGRTGYATSEDGITWVKFNYNPIINTGIHPAWDFQEFWPTTVIFEDSVYKMWCSGLKDNYAIGYATAAVTIHVPSVQTTIQAGIDSAKDGEVVLVDEGTYYENINFKGKKITVASIYHFDQDTSHISATIIDGSQHQNPDSGSVVYFGSGEDSNSVLCGFTVTGGSGTKDIWEGTDIRTGGGVFIFLSGGKLINNRIVKNQVTTTDIYAYGAGIGAYGKDIIIRDNEIKFNTVNGYWGGGAGADIATTETLLFESNTVTHNIYNALNLGAGGGVMMLGDDFPGKLILNGNLIKDNESHGSSNHGWGYGGGIYIEGCSPILTNNLIVENISGQGGGLYTATWASNDSVARPVLINNTIAKNTAKIGGGIRNKSSETRIINTIIYANESDFTYNSQISDDFHLIKLRNSLVQDGWHGDTVLVYKTDPMFKDLENNDFHLTQFSPCVGRGIDAIEIDGVVYYAPQTDCEDNVRPCKTAGDEKVDIGAFESIYEYTHISEQGSRLLKSFFLSQNYPNPFNPLTTINYELPITNYVELNVFNLLGQKVATLVDKKQPAGRHQVEWDASKMASGVYYYKLVAGEFSEVRKMILIR